MYCYKNKKSSHKDQVIQRYIYTGRNGPAPQGYENHHLMPSSILENGIPGYCNHHNVGQKKLTRLLDEEFDSNSKDVVALTHNQHSAPHLKYTAYALQVLNNAGGFIDMVDEILLGRGDIEDRVMSTLSDRVLGDQAVNRSINY